jgi:hypothetical protein
MSSQKNLKMTAFMMVLCSAFVAPTVNAGVNQVIEDALKFSQKDASYGQIKLNLRYRYEQNDSKNPSLKTANASTIRLQIGYLTPELAGFQGYVQYENNQVVVEEDYDSSRNGKTLFEKIVDPKRGVLDQFWLKYKGFDHTEIKLGRQRIELNNERFLSGLNWRQMQQNFDGLLITNNALPNTKVTLGYIVKRQAIDATVQTMQFPFINVDYNVANYGNLTAYALLMDFNEKHEDSNQTYGIRFEGNYSINKDIKANYLTEYAYQRDYVQSPVKYSTHYYHLASGITAFGVTIQAGVEQLGGKGEGKTFDTPLGLLHYFNGWADQFLVTPNNGLRDVYGSLAAEIAGVKLTGVYHKFTDSCGKAHLGDEWNFLLSYDFAKHYTVLAKYAYFDADAGSDKFDTQKFWLSAEVRF